MTKSSSKTKSEKKNLKIAGKKQKFEILSNADSKNIYIQKEFHAIALTTLKNYCYNHGSLLDSFADSQVTNHLVMHQFILLMKFFITKKKNGFTNSSNYKQSNSFKQNFELIKDNNLRPLTNAKNRKTKTRDFAKSKLKQKFLTKKSLSYNYEACLDDLPKSFKLVDFYQSYLEFSRVFNTYLYALALKMKTYTDEKSFYKDFEPFLTIFYDYKKLRRADGYHYLNLSVYSPKIAFHRENTMLEQIYNRVKYDPSLLAQKSYRHFIMTFLAPSSSQDRLEDVGESIITFWVMKLFICLHVKGQNLINSSNTKAQDLYKHYREFSKDFYQKLLYMQDHLQFYDNNQTEFVEKFKKHLQRFYDFDSDDTSIYIYAFNNPQF